MALERAILRHRSSASLDQLAKLLAGDHRAAVCQPRHRTDRNVRVTGPTEAVAIFVQKLNNPTSPAGDGAFGIVTGAIWPTQIWLEA